jgi:hypothetical protein
VCDHNYIWQNQISFLAGKLIEYEYYDVNIVTAYLGDEHSSILGDIEKRLLDLLSIGYVAFCLLELL